ncbi:MAG: hypothetical protein KA792_06415 [Bacteroidales bacterium]|nr:hypothetical protein [Bacteroidales bacterium]
MFTFIYFDFSIFIFIFFAIGKENYKKPNKRGKEQTNKKGFQSTYTLVSSKLR